MQQATCQMLSPSLSHTEIPKPSAHRFSGVPPGLPKADMDELLTAPEHFSIK